MVTSGSVAILTGGAKGIGEAVATVSQPDVSRVWACL